MVQLLKMLTLWLRSSFHIVFLMDVLIIFQGLTASLISESGSFAQPVTIEGTYYSTLTTRIVNVLWYIPYSRKGITLFSQFTLTQRIQ